MEIKPLINNYLSNIEKYFVDLNLFYANHQRPKGWKIHSTKHIWYRGYLGKFKVPINKYFYFDDNGKKKISYIDNQHLEVKNWYEKQNMIHSVLNTDDSYSQISARYNNAYSVGWFANHIKKIIQDKLNDLEPKLESKFSCDHNRIYVEIDDSYLKIRTENKKAKKFRCRLVMLHQGKNNEDKIINKTSLIIAEHEYKKDKNQLNLSSKIMQIIDEKYGIKNPEIYLISDGAKWMKQLAKSLNVTTHFLDKFHVNQQINTALRGGLKSIEKAFFDANFHTKENMTIAAKIKQLINLNQVDEALFYLYKLKNLADAFLKNSSKSNQILILIKYLFNNKKLIESWNDPFWIGSRTEAFISHYIKKKNKKKFSIFGKLRINYNILSQANENLKIILEGQIRV